MGVGEAAHGRLRQRRKGAKREEDSSLMLLGMNVKGRGARNDMIGVRL
jgi:hypothetical protein